MTDKPKLDDEDFIYCYTRADALADGVLIDLTQLAREAGFKWPTAITAAAWAAAVASPADCPEQSAEGRAWDVLNVLRAAAVRTKSNQLRFNVSVRRSPTTSEVVALKAVVHPDDDGQPAITIMLPGED